MNNPMEMVKDVSKQLVSTMIKREITGWPPDCMMLAYQPIRPASEDHTISKIEVDKG